MKENGIKIFFIFSLLSGIFFGFVVSEVELKTELGLLTSYRPTTPTQLFDINGIKFAELFKHKQQLVQYQDIPPQVIQAFIAVEDDNFFNHFGIDFVSILRAIVVNLIALEIKQGGSTLTQQLAKAVLKNRKKTFARKFKEAILTLQIEESFTKEEILELYFNLIYLGHGTTGLSSAADLYFRKKVEDLTLVEASVLSRLPKAPVYYSPFKNPRESMSANKEILKQIAKNGFLKVNDVEKTHLNFWKRYWPFVITQSPSRSTWGEKQNDAPHFTEHVRFKLEKELGDDLVYTGGLKVYTTLDIRKQIIASNELKIALEEHNKKFKGKTLYENKADRSLVSLYNLLGSIFSIAYPEINKFDTQANFRVDLEKQLINAIDLLMLLTPAERESGILSEFRKRTSGYSINLQTEGAVISIDHSTGTIQTMVGGYEFTPKNQFNRALMARRQTGSAFKPFVYGAGINERTVGSGTGIMDAPLTTMTEDGEVWSPQDFMGDFKGMVPLSKALALSLNIVSVQVFMRTGAEPIIDFASKLTKVPKRLFPDSPALALGAAELTPFEMATGYSILANKGRNVIPYSIRYVLDQTDEIVLNEEKKIQEELKKQTDDGSIQIISEGAAYIMKKMLIDVARFGTPAQTLREKKWADYHGESAGKTGSTSSFTNAWYCGFDPILTTIVWLGFDKSSISLGNNQSAAGLAVPIWGKMYRRFYDGANYPKFEEEQTPNEVIRGAVCAKNGLSPKKGVCPLMSNMMLKPITVNGVRKAVPFNKECDGDRDHIRSVDFREFLQKEYEISDEEIGKTDNKKFKIKNN